MNNVHLRFWGKTMAHCNKLLQIPLRNKVDFGPITKGEADNAPLGKAC